MLPNGQVVVLHQDQFTIDAHGSLTVIDPTVLRGIEEKRAARVVDSPDEAPAKRVLLWDNPTAAADQIGAAATLDGFSGHTQGLIVGTVGAAALGLVAAVGHSEDPGGSKSSRSSNLSNPGDSNPGRGGNGPDPEPEPEPEPDPEPDPEPEPGSGGNDVYRLPSGGERNTGWATIRDTGGTDWIEASQPTTTVDAHIDLRVFVGTDIVAKQSYMEGSNGYRIAEGVVIENARGGDGNDTIIGNGEANELSGRGGDDRIYGGSGNDVLRGGAGADTFSGGAGYDRMYAGRDQDRDVFKFLQPDDSPADSDNTRDQIFEFMANVDRIDLSEIDADINKDGNQAFRFSGDGAATNSVWFTGDLQDSEGKQYTRVSADVNGDTTADFEIDVYSDSTEGLNANDLFGMEHDSVYTLPSGGERNTDWETIRDAGGKDKIEASQPTTTVNAHIDLRVFVGTDAVLKQSHMDDINWGYRIAEGVVIEDASGGDGNDTIIGNDEVNVLRGRRGNDKIDGGAGNDTIYGGSGNDIIRGGAGHDTIYTEWSGRDEERQAEDGIENTAYGGDGDDTIIGGVFGNTAKDHLEGGDGNDVLKGRAGEDTLIGGAGYDQMYAGNDQDRDVFKFLEPGDSPADSDNTRDQIFGFKVGHDKIDLGEMDADINKDGNQAFLFSGDGAAANSVWFTGGQQDSEGKQYTRVSADVNGNGSADFEIDVYSIGTLAQENLLLGGAS